MGHWTFELEMLRITKAEFYFTFSIWPVVFTYGICHRHFDFDFSV